MRLKRRNTTMETPRVTTHGAPEPYPFHAIHSSDPFGAFNPDCEDCLRDVGPWLAKAWDDGRNAPADADNPYGSKP